jgi:segregation and condensation protein B
MSDIENPTPAVEEPDALALVRDQAAAKEKAGKEEEEKDDDDDDDDDDEAESEDDDESGDDDDSDDDESEDDEDEKPAKAAAAADTSEPVEISADAVIETVAAEAVAIEAIAASAAVAPASGENVTDVVSPDHAQHLRLLEALIFAGTQALDEKELVDRLPNDADVKRLLADLAELYAGRGVNLVQVAGGYAFRTASDLSEKLKIEKPVTRKLSRASVETLAIIAYHQPVTRAEIEQVRGVGLSKGTLDLLFEQNWIKPMGRRRAPGKPVTWGTTDFFLEHFGLPSLDDLPGQEELKAAGLLDARSQPPIFRPDEPDLPLEPTEDEADEPLAVEESPADPGR